MLCFTMISHSICTLLKFANKVLHILLEYESYQFHLDEDYKNFIDEIKIQFKKGQVTDSYHC